MLSFSSILIFVCSLGVINAQIYGTYCGSTICYGKSVCVNGQCWPEDANRGCVYQSNCPLHYTCQAGRCKIYADQYYMSSAYRTCASTSQCEKYHMCRSGRCWKSAIPNHTCSSDFSCPNNDIYMCVNGQCKIPGDGKSYGSCSSNNQCPINHVCENKKCYPAEQGGSGCTFDSECYKSDLYQCAYRRCRLKSHLMAVVRNW